MADEITVPLLPCRDIDEIAEFYGVLGFATTYRQLRPNPYVALQRDDLALHFFGMSGFDPDDSYGTCLVLTPDIAGLHAAFAAGMRQAYGKVLVSGIPRMTRPRRRRNAEGVTGFSLVDPGGNWIRVAARGEVPAEKAGGRLATVLANAVVLADSHGDHRQAAKIIDGALRRAMPDDDPVALVELLAYRAEIATVLGDAAAMQDALERADRVELTDEQREQLASTLAMAAELRA